MCAESSGGSFAAPTGGADPGLKGKAWLSLLDNSLSSPNLTSLTCKIKAAVDTVTQAHEYYLSLKPTALESFHQASP